MCTGVVVRPCQKMLEAAEQLRVSGHHRVADAENFAKLRQSPVPEGEPANPDTGYVARRSFAPVIVPQLRRRKATSNYRICRIEYGSKMR